VIDPDQRESLLQRLSASRATLMAALEGVTERDFASDLGGETVVQMLARVAAEERAAVAEARGLTEEPHTVARPLPPQAIHGLAGARYITSRYLDDPEARLEVGLALVEGVEQRDAEAARRVRGRPSLQPPPEIPVIQPGSA